MILQVVQILLALIAGLSCGFSAGIGLYPYWKQPKMAGFKIYLRYYLLLVHYY